MSETKGSGVTESERYLKYLCEKTFLSLWSYPNVYNDKRQVGTSQGKELCDLLVVFGNDVIIFSDKSCAFPSTGDLNTDWKRWYKKTILKSAEQAWGAERWLRTHPDRLFLDKMCNLPFPIKLPDSTEMKIHIIVVSHEASVRCQEELGGSGSLTLCTATLPDHIKQTPFCVADLNIAKTFIHVFDDTTLDILLGTLTTVTDFIRYLNKKEALFRSGKHVLVHGEENLLANYLENINEAEEHDFQSYDDYEGLEVPNGLWEKFKIRPERIAQLKADKISYAWDGLIEKFTHHLTNKTLYHSSHENEYALEKALRLLSSEDRTRRRIYSTQIIELLNKTDPSKVNKRFAISEVPGEVLYVFMVLAKRDDLTEEDYRKLRQRSLHANCMALKLRFPSAGHVVGIAIGMRSDEGSRSEDLEYLDAREWNDELQQEALELMRIHNIPVDLPTKKYLTVREYPEVK